MSVLELERAAPPDPTEPAGFIRIEASLAQMLKRKSRPAQALIIQRVMVRFGNPPTTEGGLAAFEAAIRAELQGMAAPTAAATAPTIATSTRSVYARTRNALRRKLRLGAIDFRFSRTDHEAVAFLRDQHTFFMRSATGSVAKAQSQAARRIVGQGLFEGLGTRQIAEDLRSQIGNRLQKAGYLETLASVFVNRTRTAAELNSYSRLGIERFRFEAVLDERTTDVCHFMDGKEWSVGEAQASIREAGQAPEPEDVRFILPFMKQRKDSDGDPAIQFLQEDGSHRTVAKVLESAIGTRGEGGKYDQVMSEKQMQDAGLGPPPAHFRCRSDAVPI